MATATKQATDMSTWASVTQHWRTSDGLNLAVEAADQPVPEGAVEMIDDLLVAIGSSFQETRQVLRPTTIVPCDPDGSPLDDVVPEPLHTFPPGTTHQQALILAGYEIGE